MPKSIVEERDEALARITTLETELATAQTELTQAKTSTDSAVTAAVAPLNEQISALTIERDTANSELATAKEAIAAKDGEIAKLKGDAKTAGQKAVDIAAAQNTPAVGAEPKATGQGGGDPDDVVARYNELLATDPAAATAYFREHRAAFGKARQKQATTKG